MLMDRAMQDAQPPPRLSSSVDLEQDGRQIGELRLVHSDDRHAFGHIPIPIAVLRNGFGPTLLLVAGIHGDEYEGQIALLKLIHALDPRALTGRVIVLPSLNYPAVAAARRVSPLDGKNLNRAFLGDPQGGPTATIADYVIRLLLPLADAVFDLHSGGSTAVYADCALAYRAGDAALHGRNLALADATGLGLLWLAAVGSPSLNAAALAQGVPMIAAEFGGGGVAGVASLAAAETAVEGVMRATGVLPGGVPPPTAPARVVEITGPACYVAAPGEGLFEPLVQPGDEVAYGETVGRLHHWSEPDRPPRDLAAFVSGTVLACAARSPARRGDHLAVVAQPTER
jgi:predicted deacylase